MRMKRASDGLLQLSAEVVFFAGCISQSGQDQGTAYETSLKVEDVVTNYGL